MAPTTAGALRAYATTAAVLAAARPAGASPPPLLVAPGAAAAPATATATAAAGAASLAAPGSQVQAPGTGTDRDLFDGIDFSRPFEIIPHTLTNLTERITGVRDPRTGRALSEILMAGQGLVQAGLRSMSSGTGAVATGSSVLGKILPVVGLATGAMQIWSGWNELESHDEGILSLIHSRTARTGMLQVLAGAMLFVPGVGGALAGSLLRIGAAANEMDTFKSLDWPSVPIEQRGTKIARSVHPLDSTPTDPTVHREPANADPAAGSGAHQVADIVAWVKDHLTPRND